MLDGYVSEKEQLEAIKKWWDDNGKWIAIAVIVGVALGFGWRYFHRIETRRLENASQIYQVVLEADKQNQFKTSQDSAALLIKDFPNTPYAGMAALLLAKEAVSQNQLDVALSQLNWVIDHAKSMRQKQIARILGARILLSQHKTQNALAMIQVVNDKSFSPLINWVRGDIETQLDQEGSAQADYQRAKNGLSDFPPAIDWLNQLLAQPLK